VTVTADSDSARDDRATLDSDSNLNVVIVVGRRTVTPAIGWPGPTDSATADRRRHGAVTVTASHGVSRRSHGQPERRSAAASAQADSDPDALRALASVTEYGLRVLSAAGPPTPQFRRAGAGAGRARGPGAAPDAASRAAVTVTVGPGSH
jgi:hypothetical protein